jgi:ketosteroid isomerase-like protein
MTLLSEQFNENKNNNDGYELRVSSAEIFEADTRANIDIQVATSKKFPRNLRNVLENIYFLATQDIDTADNCFYSIKRDGKVIRGASIRLAEIMANCYGNLRSSARIISNDGRIITAQGMCWDLENNVAYSIEVKRKITDKTGRPFSEDMVVVTSNAACSIAIRNAIFKCIPLALTNRIQERIKLVMMGEEKDFNSIRKSSVEYFEKQGVAVKNILNLFDKKSIDEIFDLKGIATAIKDGDTTLELAFSISLKPTAVNKASKTLSVSLAEENEEANDVNDVEKGEVDIDGIGVPNSINVVHEIEPNNEPEKMDEPKLEEKAEKKLKKDKGELF